jgi:osmoprotectant transport system permease protein
MIAKLSWLSREPLTWSMAALIALTLLLPYSRPLFAALFPWLRRPVFALDAFSDLVLGHLGLVAAASGAAALLGVGAGIAVTRPWGAEFRAIVETTVTIGQTFPPAAVLAVAVPAIGFGFAPAFIALLLYGLLPVVENTIAAIDAVPEGARDAARGLGMGAGAILWRVELPLATPIILAGLRTSTIIAVGTAAIAATVGARTLGLPIIVGLNGANIAYVLQGATLLALLAIVLDLGFSRLVAASERWRQPRDDQAMSSS